MDVKIFTPIEMDLCHIEWVFELIPIRVDLVWSELLTDPLENLNVMNVGELADGEKHRNTQEDLYREPAGAHKQHIVQRQSHKYRIDSR